MKTIKLNDKQLRKLFLNSNKCYDCVYYEKCESKITNKKYESKIKKINNLKLQIDKLQKELKEL